MENKKTNQQGITLLSVVITVIVLLILATVTMRVTTRSNIISKAEQEKWIVEVTQIKEALKEEKLGLKLIDKEEEIERLTLNDLDIASDLKTKYQGKLVIRQGRLEAGANLTQEERGWISSLLRRLVLKRIGV